MSPFMPTVTLSPDALVRIEGGEVVTWAECERRLLAARTPAPEGEACPTCNGVRPEFCSNAFHLASPVVPAPEGEAWRTVPVEPTEVMIKAANALWGNGTGVNYVQLEPEDFYAAMLAASPVVPVGSGETLPPISLDGPHKIAEHRQWLARQLLDSRQDDAEAYSTVIYSPAMTDIWRDDVVPVGVSREEIAEILKDEVLTDGGIIMSSEPSSRRRLRIADRILAALRPTDTGRE